MRTNGSDAWAFPIPDAVPTDEGGPSPDGFTKREYAAVHIMAAMMSLANPENPRPKELAFIAVSAADALFDELVKE